MYNNGESNKFPIRCIISLPNQLLQPAFCSTLLIKNIKKHYQAYKTTFHTKSRDVALPYANITQVKVQSIQK